MVRNGIKNRPSGTLFEGKEAITVQEKTAAVKALLFLTVTLALYLLLWQLAERFFALPVYYYARLIELLAIGLFALLAWQTPMRFEEMGIAVSARTLARSLALGAGVSAVGIGALALFGAFRGTLAPAWRVAGDVSRFTYLLVAPMQEILAKSVMLYSFELILDRRHPRLATCLSALAFAAFHVVYGFRMMVLAMALTLVTGWMFHRVRCVWGCALTHFALGFFPVCLGF